MIPAGVEDRVAFIKAVMVRLVWTAYTDTCRDGWSKEPRIRSEKGHDGEEVAVRRSFRELA